LILMGWISRFLSLLQKCIAVLRGHYAAYAAIGAVKTRKFPAAQKQHRYAIMIAARNEEGVIGHLLESIRSQDYPLSLITVFVVADNCTDRTAEMARAGGAVCYERFDTEKKRKGYALSFLLEQVYRDFGRDTYEGFFVFDADNLLASDYISRMNDAFDAGETVITSYRSTKNFDDNWISASYAIHWLRTVRCEHRGRSFLRQTTRLQGTGFLIHRSLLADGWRFTSLAEDRELSAYVVEKGHSAAFQYDAVFYDEQPVELRVALKQRLRWARGHLWVFSKNALSLGRGMLNGGIGQRFRCYDMLCIVFPWSLLSVLFGMVIGVFGVISGTLSFWSLLISFLLGWGADGLMAAYTLLAERRRLPEMRRCHLLWFCVTFPLFDLIGKLAVFTAIFTEPDWTPVPHVKELRISDMKRRF